MHSNKSAHDAQVQGIIAKHGSVLSKAGPVHHPNLPPMKEAPLRTPPVTRGETRGSAKKK